MGPTNSQKQSNLHVLGCLAMSLYGFTDSKGVAHYERCLRFIGSSGSTLFITILFRDTSYNLVNSKHLFENREYTAEISHACFFLLLLCLSSRVLSSDCNFDRGVFLNIKNNKYHFRNAGMKGSIFHYV